MIDNLAFAWDDYRKNICNGFGMLQQRGEFVDMTIAADGHHVKVHQMVMSLVSPYIKELITSAQCPHPIIYMTGVSFTTMQAILEYAYTGEVMVSKEKIGEFLKACKDLHIRGLDNMMKSAQNTVSNMFQISTIERHNQQEKSGKDDIPNEINTDSVTFLDENDDVAFQDDNDTDDWVQSSTAKKRKADETVLPDKIPPTAGDSIGTGTDSAEKNKAVGRLQYCVSGGGNLQVVLNRYVYCLRHVRKNGERFWRCSNQQATSCPALLTTHKDTILERKNPHNHAFHDKQILKRVRAGNLFTSLQDVKTAATKKKKSLYSSDPITKGLSESYDQS